ncbi:TetR/AcrR family transcriptional regulator [Xinfangfangia pollutisoli]|uniref:TetR/AcrR family transcriptional regulator n=1 Tax=Xinfangfangia pollutisoli TaxID=2865960 RepID=UPI001CD521D7|nr:TetR/AcrR family transcriptional regulator [Xinfangfangia pollutisoli]
MRMVRQFGREDWIEAGLDALARGGTAALRVETVARQIGISKGSFYWHFRDRSAWRDALLDWWEHCAFAALVCAGEGRRYVPPAGLERALQDWARQDVAVAQCLQRVAVERRQRLAPKPDRRTRRIGGTAMAQGGTVMRASPLTAPLCDPG